MKIILLLIYFTISFFITTNAQQKSFQLQDLDFVVEKIKNNYSAYEEKHTKAYDQLLQQVRKNIATSSDSIYNFQQLMRPVEFFKDIHLMMYGTKPVIFDSLFCVSKLKEVKNAPTLQSPEEGYWKSDHDDCIVYLKKCKDHAENEYEAVIVEAADEKIQHGSIKFYLTKHKIDKYNLTSYITSKGVLAACCSFFSSKDTLITGLYSKWTKIKNYHPQYLKQFTPLADSAFIQIIDSNFVYIKVPRSNFATKHIIDSLVEANRSFIAKTPNLIIDIRHNTGGSWMVYASLFPYVFTNPVLEGAAAFRCSDDFIAKQIESLERYKKDSDLVKLLPDAEKTLDSMKKYRGKFYYEPPDTIKFDTSKYYPSVYPQKVIVLTNYKCVSASEMFIKFCQQSKKAIIAGETTWGALDNVEIVPFISPSENIKLYVPRVRMYYYNKNSPNIDFKGVQPDVMIPSTEKDWVKYMMDYVNKKE